MKKLAVFCSVAMLALTLTACARNTAPDVTPTPTPANTQTPSPSPSAMPGEITDGGAGAVPGDGGSMMDDVGNAAGDLAEGAGNAMDDAARGIGNAARNLTR